MENKTKGNKFKYIVIVIICFTVMVSIICGTIVAFRLTSKEESASLTSTVLKTKLENASELITAKVMFKDVAEYEDTGTPVLTKGDYLMVYWVTVKAGIDISKVDIKVDDIRKKVFIYLPEAEILDVKLNTDTIKCYDEKYVLFPIDEKEDMAQGIALAEEQAKKDALETGLLDLSNQQSQTLIEGILKDITVGYTLEFTHSQETFNIITSELDTSQETDVESETEA